MDGTFIGWRGSASDPVGAGWRGSAGDPGWLTVRFGRQAIGSMMRSFATKRWHARLLAGARAALLALVVSIAVARAITGPLELMLEGIRPRGDGVRSVRIKNAAAEAAALQLTLAPHDLAVIAAETADSLRGAYGAGEVDLVHRLAATHVACDTGRMREVISNLLTNALKFTPRAGHVRLETGSGQDGLARLQISDTGVGIAPGELPHVTERFFRGRRSAEMAGGSGIGLTIVAELVQAHGGALEIASEPDQGTSVTLTFPAVDSVETRRLAFLRSAAQRN